MKLFYTSLISIYASVSASKKYGPYGWSSRPFTNSSSLSCLNRLWSLCHSWTTAVALCSASLFTASPSLPLVSPLNAGRSQSSVLGSLAFPLSVTPLESSSKIFQWLSNLYFYLKPFWTPELYITTAYFIFPFGCLINIANISNIYVPNWTPDFPYPVPQTHCPHKPSYVSANDNSILSAAHDRPQCHTDSHQIIRLATRKLLRKLYRIQSIPSALSQLLPWSRLHYFLPGLPDGLLKGLSASNPASEKSQRGPL